MVNVLVGAQYERPDTYVQTVILIPSIEPMIVVGGEVPPLPPLADALREIAVVRPYPHAVLVVLADEI